MGSAMHLTRGWHERRNAASLSTVVTATSDAALLRAARAAGEHAYAPYSGFRVGAALEDAVGAVYVGCNVESASYGLTICAERAAIFAAVAAGAARPFTALALVCLDVRTTAATESRMPCGACAQVMVEHFVGEAAILVDGIDTIPLRDLLPRPFRMTR